MSIIPDQYSHRTLRLRVVGLGSVGASVAENALKRGHWVTGIDTDETRINAIRHALGDNLKSLSRYSEKHLRLAGSPTCEITHDATLVCVPTWSPNGFDRTKLIAALNALGPNLAPGELVAIESTVPPHSTRTFVRERLEACGGRVGRDFFLVASPERFDIASARDICSIAKLVGGVTPACTQRGAALYSELVDEVVALPDASTAEAAKLLENLYRFVNVALVNEIAELFSALGLDTTSVIAAASTKPFGFMPFWPSTGAGGQCIPLAAKTYCNLADEYGVGAVIGDAAIESNAGAASRVLRIVESVATSEVKRLLWMGATYKSFAPILAGSSVPAAIRLLVERGYQVDLVDPNIDSKMPMAVRADAAGNLVTSSTLAPSYDLVLIAAWHEEFGALLDRLHATLVLDLSGTAPRGAYNSTIQRLRSCRYDVELHQDLAVAGPP